MGELPPDPDLDNLPDELAQALRIRGVDGDGQEHDQVISKDELPAGRTCVPFRVPQAPQTALQSQSAAES